MILQWGFLDYPDYVLIDRANKFSELFLDTEHNYLDTELDRRQPDEVTFFFGDCEGQAVFLPVAEFDATGNKIVAEIIGYDDNGEGIWL